MIFILSAIFYLGNQDKAIAGEGSGVYNLFGSRSGTTTTGTKFYGNGQSGTTSAITFIKKEIDAAIVTFKITDASSTPSGILTYELLGSNDNFCNTASTTTTADNQVIVKDINWYKLGTEGKITATSDVATGTVVSIQNLTWNCLNVQLAGSSTIALVQLVVKDSK